MHFLQHDKKAPGDLEAQFMTLLELYDVIRIVYDVIYIFFNDVIIVPPVSCPMGGRQFSIQILSRNRTGKK